MVSECYRIVTSGLYAVLINKLIVILLEDGYNGDNDNIMLEFDISTDGLG